MNRAAINLSRTRACGTWTASLALTAGFFAAPAAQAQTTIIGGSDLLNGSTAQQLSDWLGHGPIALTNIFDKVQGQSTSLDFHAAADGKGATFSLIEVTGFNGTTFDAPVLIGGYNPQSWRSDRDYSYTLDISERTAFIFNLSQQLLFRQDTTNVQGPGYYQTYNAPNYGPTFGGGHDIFVNDSLSAGYSYLYSYVADASDVSKDIARYPSFYQGPLLDLGQIEVFALSSAVPEPQAWALMLAGIAVLGASARRSARRQG